MLETINNSPLLREEWRKHVAVNRKDPVSLLPIGKIEEIQKTVKILLELRFKTLQRMQEFKTSQTWENLKINLGQCSTKCHDANLKIVNIRDIPQWLS